jgi:hypothetical protein
MGPVVRPHLPYIAYWSQTPSHTLGFGWSFEFRIAGILFIDILNRFNYRNIMMAKKEFKPILPAGIYSMNVDEFKLSFVDRFQSAKRKLIFDKFLQFLEYILDFDIITELWLNGSFVTEKPEPDDIDAVAFFDKNKLNNLKSTPLISITNIQLIYLTDIRFIDRDNEELRSYWRGWYGFSRDERPKGFVCLKLESLK